VAEQLGYDIAERFIVASYMDNDHDSSLPRRHAGTQRRPDFGGTANKSMSSRRLLRRAPLTRICAANSHSSSIDHCE
jgi:hypothetical protein